MMFVFGVSLPALTWHLHELKMRDWSQVEKVRGIGPRALALRSGRWDSWGASEAQRDQVRPPTRLYQRAIEAYASGRIALGPWQVFFSVPTRKNSVPSSLRLGLCLPSSKRLRSPNCSEGESGTAGPGRDRSG